MKKGDYAGIGRPANEERRRLENLARGLNPRTQRWIAERGIAPGWKCLEIGAAEGSMSRWLSEQVGPTGHVVAADIEPRFLHDLGLPNVEVRELDLRTDPLEADYFDLAYCRTLLLHLPDPEAALRKLVSALRPGGWLLVQEPDAGAASPADLDHPGAERFQHLLDTIYDWLRTQGIFDAYFGRQVPALLARLDLDEAGTEASATIVRGGTPEIGVYKQTFAAMTPMLTKKAVVSPEEMAELMELFDDPTFAQVSELQFAAWGRKR